jgi:hypothetical protein
MRKSKRLLPFPPPEVDPTTASGDFFDFGFVILDFGLT